jgi:pyruvate dehydrogenase E2 component (dihydrolipoamide acetyltransferase)
MSQAKEMDVRLPQWTMDMREGDVVRWLCSEGDHITLGQEIVEIEAEKVTGTLDAPASGILARIFVPEGGTAEVGERLALILLNE